MNSYDALIIGGGPAGSSCARRLTAAGMSVLVLDKTAFPRDKPCAGWITPQVVAALKIDQSEYAREHVWQPITGFTTGVIGGREVRIAYDQPVSYGIRRCEFDTYLLHRCGAELQLGEAVKHIHRDANEWVVGGRFRAPLLVGAGGHFCPVARLLGARRQEGASVVRAQEVEFVASAAQLQESSVRADTPELFFCRDLGGYGWCFRKGHHLNIGLGRLEAKDLGRHIDDFCDFLRGRSKLHGDITGRFVGHAYQLYERIQPKLIDDGVLLVGDAAGFAYPMSGEGIRPAVESGLMAAEVITAADSQYAAADLAPYEAKVRERFGKPAKDGLLGLLPSAWVRAAAARLFANGWFSRRVIVENWFLHKHQPALRQLFAAG